MAFMLAPTTTPLRSLERGGVGEKGALGLARAAYVERKRQTNAKKRVDAVWRQPS